MHECHRFCLSTRWWDFQPIPRDAHPQGGRSDDAAHGRCHFDRFTVDAHRDRWCVRFDDDLVRDPLVEGSRAPTLDQSGGLSRVGDTDGEHAEQTAVDAGPASHACQIAHLVRVVADQYCLRALDRGRAVDQ